MAPDFTIMEKKPYLKLPGSIDGAVTPGTVAGRAVGSVIESCDADILIDGVHADNQIGTTSCMYESADQ